VKFIGTVDFAAQDPSKPDSWEWKLQKPFAQVTSDGYVIICRPNIPTDGASIPRFLWSIIGHPFRRANRFWSQPHDQGYDGVAMVLPIEVVIEAVRLEDILTVLHGRSYVFDAFEDDTVQMPRKWWDEKCNEAMKLTNENFVKRFLVYSGIRVGGWVSWNRSRAA